MTAEQTSSRGKLQDPTLGMGKSQSAVPLDLLELGSGSPAPQTLLYTVVELVLGSLGCTEVRDDMFLVLDTADAAGCGGRAEKGVGAHLLHQPRPEGENRVALARSCLEDSL